MQPSLVNLHSPVSNTITQRKQVNESVNVYLDRDSCGDCQSLLLDLLTNRFSASRWATISTDYSTIKVFTRSKHNPNNQACDSGGDCNMCCAIFDCETSTQPQKVHRHQDGQIFIKPFHGFKYQFFTCSGDVAQFALPKKKRAGPAARHLGLYKQDLTDTQANSSSLMSRSRDLYLKDDAFELPELPVNNQYSEWSFGKVSKWQRKCSSEHPNCRPSDTELPKRLLDISRINTTNKVHLYLTEPHQRGEYATISYSWGSNEYPRLKLRSDTPNLTVERHRAGKKLDEYPQTLQDAIRVANKIGFTYVWIDSVCIDQASNADWDQQSRLMTQIYGCAQLNISATSSKNSSFGCFTDYAHHYGLHVADVEVQSSTTGSVDRPVTTAGSKATAYRISVRERIYPLDLEDMPLSRRGWVFQERLVSNATLHYTSYGLFWECRNGLSAGHDVSLRKVDWKTQWSSTMRINSFQDQEGFERNRERVLDYWLHWISAYAERELHVFSDRLPAISGLARELAQTYRLNYVAGLWQEDMLRGLMWKRFIHTETLIRSLEDSAPSWSWASTQGRLDFVTTHLDASYKGPLLRFTRLPLIEEESPGYFGKVLRGELHVEALVQQITIDAEIHPEIRQRPWNEIGVVEGFVNLSNVKVTLDEPKNTDSKLWCLRLGSYDAAGREADVFLLLSAQDEKNNRFRRIGLVETASWSDKLMRTPYSGELLAPELRELTLI